MIRHLVGLPSKVPLTVPLVVFALGLTGCSSEGQQAGPPTLAARESTPTHFTVRGRWPDPLRVTYRVEDRGAPIDVQSWRGAVERACAAWTATGTVALVTAEPDREADVTLGWRRGHHGACEPFSTASAVAHSGPVRSGTFVHFDAGREWVVDASHDRDGYSVYATAMHELGHVLGLGHSVADDAVMRTGVIRSTPLAPSDLFGLQSLYGGGVDARGDLRIVDARGDDRSALRGVAPVDLTDFCVFDADGDGSDDVLVWRVDRAGNGGLMIYHFTSGVKLARTTGPLYGMIAAGAGILMMRTAAGDRLLVVTFGNGRRIALRFDQHAVLRAFSPDLIDGEELAAAEARGNLRAGDLDGDGQRERVLAVR